MGREKRIAESRAKEVLEKTKGTTEPRRAAPAGESAAASAPVIPMAEKHTGTAKALLEILALYAVPVIIMLIVGRLLLHM